MMEIFFLAIFIAIAIIMVWMLACAGAGVLVALIKNSFGGAIWGGFVFWFVAGMFFDCAWNDLSAAWWGAIIGALIGLFLTYQDAKYLF